MHARLLLWGIMVGFPALALAAQDLRISNRAPQPGEVGYQPADGAAVRLNPPSFIWLHETNAQTYAVQWARQGDFSDVVTVTNLPWNTYTHHAPFEPGAYVWRYRFAAPDGRVSNWSLSRRVVVPTEAQTSRSRGI